MIKKHLFVFVCAFSSFAVMAQGHKGSVSDCAPMKRGKVCYTDMVEMPGLSRDKLFDLIDVWARNNYGKDVFMSNVNSNKLKRTVLVSSKVELLLNDSTKTFLSYKMFITCEENKYTSEVRDIVYQYDAKNNKRFKTYRAEEVIADNGASNTASTIKDPVLFCNATFFFVENLFAEVNQSVKLK